MRNPLRRGLAAIAAICPADTSYEVYRNGQEWVGSFPILDVAKSFIENDKSTDCFTIKEVPCVWGDSDKP